MPGNSHIELNNSHMLKFLSITPNDSSPNEYEQNLLKDAGLVLEDYRQKVGKGDYIIKIVRKKPTKSKRSAPQKKIDLTKFEGYEQVSTSQSPDEEFLFIVLKKKKIEEPGE